MKIQTVLLPFAFVACPLFGDVFQVGGRLITVPAPAGFVRITNDMPQVTRVVAQMTDPLNDTLAFYISSDAAPSARAGGIPALDQYFVLKVNKQLRDSTIGVSDFSKLKTSVKTQNMKVFEDIKAKLPDMMGKIGENVKKEFNVKMAIDISQVVPLEPHHEGENTFSYSMYINYGITSADSKEVTITAASATFINTAGSLLFLYSYGRKDDLEWTRASSASWAESILKVNPPPPQKALGRGIDWNQVGLKSLAGAIIGGFLALIGKMISKKRKSGG